MGVKRHYILFCDICGKDYKKLFSRVEIEDTQILYLDAFIDGWATDFGGKTAKCPKCKKGR